MPASLGMFFFSELSKESHAMSSRLPSHVVYVVGLRGTPSVFVASYPAVSHLLQGNVRLFSYSLRHGLRLGREGVLAFQQGSFLLSVECLVVAQRVQGSISRRKGGRSLV